MIRAVLSGDKDAAQAFRYHFPLLHAATRSTFDYADLLEPTHNEFRSSGVAVMNHARTSMIFSLTTSLILLSTAGWGADPSFNRKQDVIYGRKFGTALTMDVFIPNEDPKGIGVIIVVSGGFFSSHELI